MSSMKKIHVVASASMDKKSPDNQKLRISAPIYREIWTKGSIDDVLRAWTNNVQEAKDTDAVTPANRLYTNYARVGTLRLVEAERAIQQHEKVLSLHYFSAGLGVVRNDERIVNYAATFLPSNQNYVGSAILESEAPTKWWRELKKHMPETALEMRQELFELGTPLKKHTVLFLLRKADIHALSDDLHNWHNLGMSFIILSPDFKKIETGKGKIPIDVRKKIVGWRSKSASLRGTMFEILYYGLQSKRDITDPQTYLRILENLGEKHCHLD